MANGQPLINGSLVSHKDKIIFVGGTANLDAEYLEIILIKVSIIMPRMWDCHVHFIRFEKTSVDDMASVPPALAGARSTRDVAATLNAGYTSVREIVSYGAKLSIKSHQ